MKYVWIFAALLTACVNSAGQFDAARTVQVTRAGMRMACRVFGVVDSAVPETQVQHVMVSSGGALTTVPPVDVHAQ